MRKCFIFLYLFCLFAPVASRAIEPAKPGDLDPSYFAFYPALESTEGIFHDCEFACFQTGVGLFSIPYLFDGKAFCVIDLALFQIDQYAGVLSATGFRTALGYNDGVQTSLLLDTTIRNYGLSIAPLNGVMRNKGVQIGVVNGNANAIQFCGADVGSFLQIAVLNGLEKNTPSPDRKFRIGIVNINLSESEPVDVGIFNTGESALQIGLLNHNPHGFLPWFPLFNFNCNSSDLPSRE